MYNAPPTPYNEHTHMILEAHHLMSGPLYPSIILWGPIPPSFIAMGKIYT